MKFKKTILIILICIVSFLIGFLIYRRLSFEEKNNNQGGNNNNSEVTQIGFDYKIIHMVNTEENNYLISPLSIAYALSILNEGATDNTKKQVSNVLGNYNLGKTASFEDKISIANALFIKEEKKNSIKADYINTLKEKFDADVLFDEFKTPDVINNWAEEKTFGMIKDVLNYIDDDFVFGIMNAIAIDVEWKYKFEVENTNKKSFTNYDKSTSTVDMMNTENTFTYIENDNAKGIIKEYQKYGDAELEFIAILPNTDIKEYINNFDEKELNSLLSNKKESSDKLDLYLELPKFKYDYTYDNFTNDLKKLGITDAFNLSVASFKNITNDDDYKIFVSQAIHKTHIELTEDGTKAAAITYIAWSDGFALRDEKDRIEIKFNKPFLYIIKDKNSDNIWFFGTVYNLPDNK